MMLPAVPQDAADTPQYVPVLVKDSGNTAGLVRVVYFSCKYRIPAQILVGLALGLILGMVIGSIAYNAWQVRKCCV